MCSGRTSSAASALEITVAPNEWQAACSLGDFSLVGCTVSPAFEFAHFELAPKGWSPGD